MTAAYDPHAEWAHEDQELERRRELLTRITGYFDTDTDPLADTWKEAS